MPNINYTYQLKCIRVKFERGLEKLKAERRKEIKECLADVECRNDQIMKFYTSGKNYASIARLFDLSSPRVVQIIKKRKSLEVPRFINPNVSDDECGFGGGE